MYETARPPTHFIQRILDNLSSAVLVFDSDLCLVYVNPAGEMLFAASARQVLGQQISALFTCTDDEATQHLLDARLHGHPLTEREITLKVTGREITVDCTVVPLAESEGDTLVELHQVDRQLRIFREEQLVSQHKATRDLIRGLAHEIKNPLGGLRGAAQLLAGELQDPELHEYTDVIINEADRLQALVDRMLGPNERPAIAEVNIHQVLERVRQLVQAESGSGLKIIRDYDPSIPLLEGDADQLIQAFLNLVRNAARAVGPDGRIVLRSRIQRQITIGADRHKLVAQVDVIDNGPGIPDELRASLFYPLVSASDGGVGLGLSIAQSLVQRHRGLIECTSRPGETTFTVLLPLENGK
jgi:two-component system nitrogen regulation sensor histidine kinase GlnL